MAPRVPRSSGQHPKVFLISQHPSSFCRLQGCRATPRGVVMPGREVGPGCRVLSSAFPAGPFSRAVCLPLAPERAPTLGRVFPRRADAAGKPSRRQSYAPVVPDDAPCGNTGGASWGGNGIGMDGIRWNGKVE